MKNLSKIIAVFFFALLFFSHIDCETLKYESAFAMSTPYVVIGEDVWMLGENGNKLFLLPETYYAKIDRMDDNYYYVTFNGVSGKLPKNSVSVVGYDKGVRDTRRIIRIADEYSVFTEIRMKKFLEGENKEEITVPTGENLTYVGTYKQGDSVWYYVNYATEYGYVLNTYTDTPVLRTEKFIPEEDPQEEMPETAEENSEEKNSDLIKIIIIGGVSAVALILIIILFLPRKNKRHRYYYS